MEASAELARRPETALKALLIGRLSAVFKRVQAVIPLRQVGALLVLATVWVAVYKLYSWIITKIWSEFRLESGSRQQPGYWVGQLAKSVHVPSSQRLEALRLTDREGDVHKIEVEHKLFSKVRKTHLPIEPQLQEDAVIKVVLPAEDGEPRVTAQVTVGEKHTTVHFNKLYCDPKQSMRRLLERAHGEWHHRVAKHTDILRYSTRYERWLLDVPPSDRLSLDSFIMPNDFKDELGELLKMVRDSNEFFSSRDWVCIIVHSDTINPSPNPTRQAARSAQYYHPCLILSNLNTLSPVAGSTVNAGFPSGADTFCMANPAAVRPFLSGCLLGWSALQCTSSILV